MVMMQRWLLASLVGVSYTQTKEPKKNLSASVKKTAVASKNVWQSIQKQSESAIVQIISYTVQPDLLRPYTKESSEGRGSGAFVEGGKGLILTCFHVIENCSKVGIQMPLYFGKRMVEATVVGVCPDYDMALLQLDPAVCAHIEKEYGSLPFLKLGDSSKVDRSDQLLGLGFPLGDESLKSVTGVVSGAEHIVSRNGLRLCTLHAIQVTTPLNPGSSGGPVLNEEGEVIGIATAGSLEGQNVGFVAPINHYKLLATELKKGGLVRKPTLGVTFCRARDAEIAQWLGNPVPAGCYITHVLARGLGASLGLQEGDMIYSLDGFLVDPYGCIQTARVKDRMYVTDYLSSLSLGHELVIELYRSGERIVLKGALALRPEPPIRWNYFPYDSFDYEVIGGVVIQELSLNIIALFEHTQLGNQFPGVRARLIQYKEETMRDTPVLVVTEVFSSSVAYNARSFRIGSFIASVNGKEVSTLAALRERVAELKDANFVVLKSEEKELLVLSRVACLQDEARLSQLFGYTTTPAMAALIQTKN